MCPVAPLPACKRRSVRGWTEEPMAPLRPGGHDFFDRGRRHARWEEQLVGRRDRECERGKVA